MAVHATPAQALDDFDYEILRNYFLTSVREMVGVTVRAAYSTCFSEGLDFSCALFDAQGRMYAQEGGLAVHLGGLFDVVQAIEQAYPEMAPGDVFIHNDPLNGGSHQADVAVAVPMYAGSTRIGTAVNRGHWIDVGGMAAGGWSGGYTHALQEGLRLPPVRLYEGGTLNREVKDILLANIRKPLESWGDLEAQLASCRAAETRIVEAIERCGMDGYERSIDYALDYSRRRLAAAIEAIEPGVYVGTDEMEDDGQGNGPFDLTARVTVGDGRIDVDLTEASPQAEGPINCSWGVVKAGVYTALKAMLDPEMPLDSALLDLVTVSAREGTWVRPVYPAPTFGSTAEPSNRVCEAVLRAFADAVPERSMAYSYSSGVNLTGSGFHPDDGSEFVFYQFGPGGCGARSDADGNSASWHPMCSCKNESIELWERRYPVRFTGFRLRPDSGGAGRFRGGLGYRKDFVVLSDVRLNAFQDRHERGAPGIFGAEAGVPNALLFEIDGVWGDAKEHFGSLSKSKLDNVRLPAGSTISIRVGGGGGWGRPTERSRAAVEHDVDFGYVTAEAVEAALATDALDEDGSA